MNKFNFSCPVDSVSFDKDNNIVICKGTNNGFSEIMQTVYELTRDHIGKKILQVFKIFALNNKSYILVTTPISMWNFNDRVCKTSITDCFDNGYDDFASLKKLFSPEPYQVKFDFVSFTSFLTFKISRDLVVVKLVIENINFYNAVLQSKYCTYIESPKLFDDFSACSDEELAFINSVMGS